MHISEPRVYFFQFYNIHTLLLQHMQDVLEIDVRTSVNGFLGQNKVKIKYNICSEKNSFFPDIRYLVFSIFFIYISRTVAIVA